MSHVSNSPSAFYRRMACPGSKRMEAGMPDTDNQYSIRGSAAHQVAEQCLKNGTAPGAFLNQMIRVPTADGLEATVMFTDEDMSAVWVYLDYINQRMGANPDFAKQVEFHSDPGLWLHRDDVAGTTDCLLLAPDEVEIIDYKHGAGTVVEPEDNPQLIQYAIGILATLDWSRYAHSMPVTMTVIQPRAKHPDGPIRKWVVPANHIFSLVQKHKEAAEATDDPAAPLHSGKHCTFCKAKGKCPELLHTVSETAFGDLTKQPKDPWAAPALSPEAPQEAPKAPVGAQDLVEVESPASGSPRSWEALEQALGRPAEQLDARALSNVMDLEPLILSWLKGVKEYALQLHMSGTPIPGRKVVRATAHRKWSVEDPALIDKLMKTKDRDRKVLGKELVTTTKPLSPAQAEKQIKPRVTERTWKNLEKLIIQPEGAPVLVISTDPREEIKNLEDVFGEVSSEPATTPTITQDNPFG